MPLLILSALRAIWTLRREPQFVSLALLAAVAIVSGTGFYSLVEGLRFVDALYFSVITLTTVGYGDFAPETDAGKLFTAVYVLVGVGILLAFVTTLAARVSQMPLLHTPKTQPRPGDGHVASAAADQHPETRPTVSAATVVTKACTSAASAERPFRASTRPFSVGTGRWADSKRV
jgi:voltage-gated potassium channel